MAHPEASIDGSIPPPPRRRRAGRWLLAVQAVALVAVAFGAMGAGPAVGQPASTGEGQIIDFEILPPEGELTVGDTITFTNNGARPHTVTDRGGTFDTDPILPGEQAQVTFDVPGNYEVFCRINPARMNATIVVAAGAEAPDEVRVQAFDENREGETKRFDPAAITVASGTTVTLANVGGLPHTLTAGDGSFSTGVVEPGTEKGRFAGNNASVVLAEPGTYPFVCEIHPIAMRGTIVVTGDPPEDGTTTRAGPDDDAAQDVAAPLSARVEMVNFAFGPTEVAVAPGGEVVWANEGGAPHTATFDDVPLDTGRVEPGTQARLTAPTEPGTYSYFCAIHPSMRATLLVPPPADDEEQDATSTSTSTITEDDGGDEAAAAGGAEAGGSDGGGDAGSEVVGYIVAAIVGATTALAVVLVARSRRA